MNRAGRPRAAGSIDIIDRSLKALFRRVPATFFRLAGRAVDPRQIRVEDVSVNLPEYRADQVFVIGEPRDRRRWAAHLEYVMQPDARRLRGWFWKNAALSAQLDRPVILIALYLKRGRYRTFPDRYRAEGGGLRNEYLFETIHLWEHVEQIRNGELPELAPLLVLCEDSPTEATLWRERELILQAEMDPSTRAELLAVAVAVGTRFFARQILEELFREELQMLKEASFIEEWIEDAAEQAAQDAGQKGLQQGREEGLQEGEARGRTEEARETLLRLLQARFGDLPEEVVARIRRETADWCRDRAVRLLGAQSLADLEF